MVGRYDVIVLGGGVIGCATAYHAARLGARKVLLIERKGLAEGTSSQSSGILRTHYSVAENVELARRSLAAFTDFAGYLDDPEADCGLAMCGYLVVGRDDARGAAIRASLARQRAMGIDAIELDAVQARDVLPLLRTDDLAVFGYESEAGYADPYLTATAFARNARRLGATLSIGEMVTSGRCSSASSNVMPSVRRATLSRGVVRTSKSTRADCSALVVQTLRPRTM